MAFDFRHDPLVKQPVDMLVFWTRVLRELIHLRSAIDKVWNLSVAKLQNTPRNWLKVAGHIDAVVATLMDLNWVPLAPDEWTDDQGNVWRLLLQDRQLIPDLTAIVEQSAERKVWKMAAQHFCGKGLENGADLTILNRHLHSLRRKGRAPEAAVLELMAQGAYWPKTRRIGETSLDDCHPDDLLCPRCKVAIEDPTHQIWVCKDNHTVCPNNGPTQTLTSDALVGVEHNPCLWLRGLVPYDWTIGRLPIPQEQIWIGGLFLQSERIEVSPGITAATDGSGGAYASDHRLRRCGFGFVLIYNLRPVAFVVGAMGGQSQTVPRAELTALIVLARKTSGNLEVFVDADYVVKGFAKGSHGLHNTNIDLWETLWMVVSDRVGSLTVVKTKAHANVDDLEAGKTDVVQLAANHYADAAANEGALRNEVLWSILSIIEWIDARTYLIQQRLVKIGMHVASNAKALYGEAVMAKASAELRKANANQNLHEALMATTHSLALGEESFPTDWKCQSCWAQPLSVHARCDWLGTECLRRPFAIHRSHLTLHCYRGVWYCDDCGFWAVRRFIGLKRICPLTPPHGAAKASLSQLRLRLLPHGLPKWPDE